MLTNELKYKLKNQEKKFISGQEQVNRKWCGFDPRKNSKCVDHTSIQRGILLTYCKIVGDNLDLSNKKAIELGVEKHRHVCLNLGLKNWHRLDRYDDIGGNKTDFIMDFVDNELLPEHIENYDVVVCSNTLEHTFDIFKGFDRVFQFCKPGGLVYFSTPFTHDLHCDPYDFWRLTPYTYEKIISQYSDNFIILEERYNHPKKESFYTIKNSILYGVSCFAIKRK